MLLRLFNLPCCIWFGLIFTVTFHFNVIQQFSHLVYAPLLTFIQGFSLTKLRLLYFILAFFLIYSSLNMSFLFFKKGRAFFFQSSVCSFEIVKFLLRFPTRGCTLFIFSPDSQSRRASVRRDNPSSQSVHSLNDYCVCTQSPRKSSGWCSFTKCRRTAIVGLLLICRHTDQHFFTLGCECSEFVLWTVAFCLECKGSCIFHHASMISGSHISCGISVPRCSILPIPDLNVDLQVAQPELWHCFVLHLTGEVHICFNVCSVPV